MFTNHEWGVVLSIGMNNTLKLLVSHLVRNNGSVYKVVTVDDVTVALTKTRS